MLVVAIGVGSFRFYVLVHVSLLGFGLPLVLFLRGSLSLAALPAVIHCYLTAALLG